MKNTIENSYSERFIFFSDIAKYPDEILLRPSLLPLYMERIKKIASTDASVLISGETGVGKEIIAKIIHKESKRKNKPFVALTLTVNNELLDDLLFGHEQGSFTGANYKRIGVLEEAKGGTLFLDEIGVANSIAQLKLLRVLQEKTFRRIGGDKDIKSDFRLISATNVDLSKEVEKGNFREDLLFRINVVPIKIPPLREKPLDILKLSQHYIKYFCAQYTKDDIILNDELNRLLQSYDWPGNVRELVNLMDRMVTEYDKDKQNLTDMFLKSTSVNILTERARMIIEALKKTNGNISKAAIELRMSRVNLHRQLIKHKIDASIYR